MMPNISAAIEGTTKAGLEKEPHNPHPNTEYIILSVILSLFCVLGTIGNALAFIIYYRKREKGTSTIFILSLAVTDFLTCLINLPYTISSLLLDYRLEYDILCKIFLFIGTFNVPLSSFIMVAIGIDRYFCICHPFLHIVTVPRAKACIIVLTIVAALLGIIPPCHTAVHRNPANTTEPSISNVSMTKSISFISNDSEATSTIGSPHLFTNGLLLEPDAEFMSDLLKHSAAGNYRTEHSDLPFSTLAPLRVFPSSNTTSSSYTPTSTSISDNNEYIEGMCVESPDILSEDIVKIYQRIYASTFLFEFVILALLYALIYRSILVRRAWKTKRKRMSCYASSNCPETAAEETQLTNINGGTTETVVLKKNPGRFSSAMRDRTLHANIKTAAMLFVVTVGFVISFLPSWLMGLRAIPFQVSVFYIFYINNVINPFIYAFMNRTFRDDLFQLLKSLFRR